MSIYRPEFASAMKLLAAISTEMDAEGFLPPVLVGGAAVEIYTAGTIATGDFDLVTARQDILEEIMQRHGFVRPSGPGVATRGWVHPTFKLGFEIVSDSLLDGAADRDYIQLIDASAEQQIAVIGIEDLIADRMGQYASGTAPEMLMQAKTLFTLSTDLDLNYLEKRIRAETAGDHGISDLENEV